MKHSLYCVLYICLMIATALPAISQITITSADVGSYLAVGTSTITKVDTGTHTVNIGTLGATSWNFSTLANSYAAGSVNINPDTTTYSAYFSGATHAIKVGTSVSYLALGTNLLFLGVAQPPPFQSRIKGVPPQILTKLPMTMGTTWTSTYAESTVIDFGGTPITSVSQVSVTNTADAFGSLTIPGGGVYQALRLKTDRHTTTGSHTYRSISYQFLAKNGVSVVVVPSDTSQPQTGNISVINTSWNVPSGVTSVEEISGGPVPSTFALEQNYPNPFNPSTTIEFSVPENSFVSLKLYDILGQELRTLVAQQLTPGKYSMRLDASGFPSGVYLYRLQSGSVTETRRLVLLR